MKKIDKQDIYISIAYFIYIIIFVILILKSIFIPYQHTEPAEITVGKYQQLVIYKINEPIYHSIDQNLIQTNKPDIFKIETTEIYANYGTTDYIINKAKSLPIENYKTSTYNFNGEAKLTEQKEGVLCYTQPYVRLVRSNNFTQDFQEINKKRCVNKTFTVTPELIIKSSNGFPVQNTEITSGEVRVIKLNNTYYKIPPIYRSESFSKVYLLPYSRLLDGTYDYIENNIKIRIETNDPQYIIDKQLTGWFKAGAYTDKYKKYLYVQYTPIKQQEKEFFNNKKGIEINFVTNKSITNYDNVLHGIILVQKPDSKLGAYGLILLIFPLIILFKSKEENRKKRLLYSYIPILIPIGTEFLFNSDFNNLLNIFSIYKSFVIIIFLINPILTDIFFRKYIIYFTLRIQNKFREISHKFNNQ